MPFVPVTRIEAALVSVIVRVSDCPDEMLAKLAVIETVGVEPVVPVTVIVVWALALPLEFIANAV